MWKNNQYHIDEEKLDRFSDEILRAFDAGEAEINNAAASPFLYRRIRARIEAEERRRAEEGGSWLALLATARRAIPALATAAVLAVSLSVYWHAKSPSDLRSSANGAQDMAFVESAPTLSNIAADDVMASLVGWQESAGNDSDKGEEKR